MSKFIHLGIRVSLVVLVACASGLTATPMRTDAQISAASPQRLVIFESFMRST